MNAFVSYFSCQHVSWLQWYDTTGTDYAGSTKLSSSSSEYNGDGEPAATAVPTTTANAHSTAGLQSTSPTNATAAAAVFHPTSTTDGGNCFLLFLILSFYLILSGFCFHFTATATT